ncbi:hypothetical protein ERO13_D11G087480v2 [Gossypium hirsutum]|uniref:Fe2OG dioxygenase domain-containing protein n=3 Tax=Gossypium TaxID=3633 RepID=A0A5J5P9I5_GOSBA|nr:hypothetical protein ES319_D11G090900v1 [Gossypium barbadense]KAG4119548.1 hypothetical protein ERO13_D11G087480v2 [Gossypium hirsutum]TYG44402.1 hypothetical protein ES288_D11G095400v1 [Gossypium darwinii]TYH42912.1 hypothetical protein ES332_D11G094000v1 [Gossypium tomentosum]
MPPPGERSNFLPTSVTKNQHQPSALDASILGSESDMPSQFIWPHHERPCLEAPQLACKKHGVFMVVNHGVDPGLVDRAHRCMDFFSMQLCEKQKAKRKIGENSGYSSGFVGSPNIVEQYFVSVMGQDFRHFGKVYQEYCEAMNKLSMEVMELLGLSLVLGRAYLRDFFQGNDSILRLNHYPPCPKPDLALGTGPHADPTALTILDQDQVGGLQVFADHQWNSLTPIPGAFVALCYKSCLHRPVVNNERARRSIAYFVCTKMNKTVTPATALVNVENPRIYPDFKWATFLEFTQKHYKVNMKTLEAFSNWLQK